MTAPVPPRRRSRSKRPRPGSRPAGHACGRRYDRDVLAIYDLGRASAVEGEWQQQLVEQAEAFRDGHRAGVAEEKARWEEMCGRIAAAYEECRLGELLAEDDAKRADNVIPIDRARGRRR